MPRKNNKKPVPPAEATPAAEQTPAEDQAVPSGFTARPKLKKGEGSVSKTYETHNGRRSLQPEEIPELQSKIQDVYALKLRLQEEMRGKAEQVKEVKGRLNESVKELEENLSFLATGSRPEMRRCLVTKHFSSGRHLTVDAETGEVYQDRELHPWERQGNLFRGRDDCQNCKYCDCKAQDGPGHLTKCPEGFEDCRDCLHFSCVLPGFPAVFCRKNKTQPDMDIKEAIAFDCYFCYRKKCLADENSCGRRIDCHSCERCRCEAPKKAIKGGICDMAGKDVSVEEKQEGGEDSEDSKDAEDDDFCYHCTSAECAVDGLPGSKHVCQEVEMNCEYCDHFTCGGGQKALGNCAKEKAEQAEETGENSEE